MKNMKKLVSLLTALLMVIAMCVPAMAAESTTTTYTITVTNTKSGHTYEAYQVFSGDLSGGVLSNVDWGTGIDSTKKDALLTALKGISTGVLSTNSVSLFANASSAADVAKALGDIQADANKTEAEKKEVAKAFAEVISPTYLSSTKTESTETKDSDEKTTGYTISGLAAGYYLVKDKDGTMNDATADAYTGYILEVVENTTVVPKSGVPTVEKKVDDKNDSDTSENGTDWQDSADYDIGDSIPYQLTGTLPSNYADYSSYSYIFTDTLSKGLTCCDTTSVKVYVVNTGTKQNVTSHFDVSLNTSPSGLSAPYTGGSVLTVTAKDTNGLKDITTEDSTETAVSITSSSTIVVEYTATLNSDAVIGSAGNPNEVYLTYSNNPNGSGNGKTTTDKVTVFTFKLVVNKVDGDGKPLAGAEFQLMKYNASSTATKEEDKYEVYKHNGAEVTATKSSTKVDATTGEASDSGTKTVENVFTFTGLDAGKYKIVETTTPAGYNTIDDIVFTVEATHETSADNPTLQTLVVKNADGTANLTTGDAATFTVTKDEGSVSTNVKNLAGSTLPETGGIGTTLFYVIGGVLVLAAVVLLVTRKRVDSAR